MRVEKLFKNEQCHNVYETTKHFSNNHVPMPCDNSQTDHTKLRKNQRRKTNPDNMNKLIFKNNQRAEHNNPTLINWHQDPYEESFIRQNPTFTEVLIQFRIGQCNFRGDVNVQNQRKHREHGVDSCVADN